MNYDSYSSLDQALKSIGLIGAQSSPDQLIVSAQEGPVWPERSNSFWLSFQGGSWYLSTWLPACYRIPAGQDVVAVCSSCMKSSTSAMYRVPDEVATQFGLERISDDEFNRLFPEANDERT